MTLARQFVQRVMQAGAQPMRVVRQQAHSAGDLVGLAEADCEDIPRQLVGIVFDDLLRMAAIFVDNPLSDPGADAEPLQIDVDIALAAFFGPGLNQMVG